MQTNREALFSTEPVGKAVIHLAIPTVISQIITVVYNMADTFYIGQLGDPNQVAAATFSMPLLMFLTALANFFGIGGSSMISRALGAGDREKARHGASFCIWSAAVCALLYGIAVVLCSDLLMPVLGAHGETAGYVSVYLFWVIGIGAVPTVLNAALAHLVRAEGYSKEASIGVAFGGVLNILLDPLFIFAFKMEIAGAAIATMLSNVAATVYFLLFLLRIRKNTAITPNLRLFTLRYAGEILTVGLPSFLMTLMSMISNTALNKMIAGYSNEAVAGMGIAKKIDMIAFAIAQGMSQGTLPLIGYNYSAGNFERMLAALKALFMDCLVVAISGMIVLFLASAPITRLFIDDAATVEYGRTFLRIVAIACPTTSLNFLAVTLFQATGKKTQPLILSLLRKGGLDVPLMVLFNTLIGVKGIAWATPLADALALCIAAALVLPYLKKIKKTFIKS